MKKKYLIILIAIIFIFSTLTACNFNEEVQNNESLSYSNISPLEAKELLDKNDKIVLLDVRTEEEYETAHIPSSNLLPLSELETKVEKEIPNKEKQIIVYCRSGRRSAIAAERLTDLGYVNVYDLGGIIDWPYETE